MERTMECNSHLLLKNAVIFTVDAENRKYRQGDILIRGNEIVAIGDTGTLTVPSGAKIKDCSGYLLMPGLVNAHNTEEAKKIAHR
jgi:cytosine/adenosine deaminase-related metal-dependent hydrolase